MPLALLIPLLLLAGLVYSTGQIARSAQRVSAWLPTLSDIDLPEPEPEEQVAASMSILKLRDARYRRGKPLERWIRDLEGKRVSIEGYMAIGTLEGMRTFELTPEDCECGQSKVNHFVQVTLTDDITRFKPGRFFITGVFESGEVKDDGFITSVYRLRATKMPR